MNWWICSRMRADGGCRVSEMQGGRGDTGSDHIVFRCRKVTRIKDVKGRGRREWERPGWGGTAGMRWYRGLEDTDRVDWIGLYCICRPGRVDEEGRSVLEKVDLMEEFFTNVRPLADLDEADLNSAVEERSASIWWRCGFDVLYLFSLSFRPRSRPWGPTPPHHRINLHARNDFKKKLKKWTLSVARVLEASGRPML